MCNFTIFFSFCILFVLGLFVFFIYCFCILIQNLYHYFDSCLKLVNFSMKRNFTEWTFIKSNLLEIYRIFVSILTGIFSFICFFSPIVRNYSLKEESYSSWSFQWKILKIGQFVSIILRVFFFSPNFFLMEITSSTQLNIESVWPSYNCQPLNGA